MKIPEKESFTLNEVSTIAGIRPYIINFWIKEFEMFDSGLIDKSSIFTSQDISNLLSLKNMMFKEKLSIESAKKRFNHNNLIKESFDLTKDLKEQDQCFDELKLNQMMAVKVKLQNLVELTESLKEMNNWS